jgi:hypothetical protein
MCASLKIAGTAYGKFGMADTAGVDLSRERRFEISIKYRS